MYHSNKSHFIAFLAILIGITSLITYYCFKLQPDFGPMWDTCDFLVNALLFAGKGIGYADLDRPPVLSFLTSIFFRLGYVSENVIYALDGLIFIFGVIGLYLMFKLRFDPFKSFLGCLIYVTSPIILMYNSLGLTDIPSISFIIWSVYFTILAFKRDSKYFYLSFPFLMISFLTRYPSVIIIFPIFLYLIMNREKLKNNKVLMNLIIGIILSVFVISPVLIWFNINFSNPFYPFFHSFGITSGASSPYLLFYNDDPLFFLKNLQYLLGKESILIVLIVIYAFICYKIQSKFWIKLNLKKCVKEVLNRLKNNKNVLLLLLLLLILVSLFIITFGNIFYMFSEVIFFIICILCYELLKESRFSHLNFDLLFISWFMSFFILHSVFVIKDIRYFVTMAPGFSYLLILGLNEISNRFRIKIRNKTNTFQIISIFLILSLSLSTASTLIELKEKSSTYSIRDDLVLASSWLTKYDPDYKDKIIYSDYWPHSAWYLKTDVEMMPLFKDNQILYSRLKEYNLNNNDFRHYNQELVNNNADYYFCIYTELNLTSYKEIKEFGKVVIYKKIDK